MKKQFKEFLIFTFIPFIIPFINLIPNKILSNEITGTLTFVFVILDGIYAWRFYGKIEEERLKKHSDKINKETFLNAHYVFEEKRDYIISKTYNEYSIREDCIPYNVHDYIADICKNFRDTIAKITHLDRTNMSVTFIYRYIYPSANNDSRSWKWIVGKEGTMDNSLNNFTSQKGTLYNYIIEDGDVDIVFCNDKRDLECKRRYRMSKRDDSHNNEGSIFGAKIVFGNNAESFVEGVLIVSSYGKHFINKENSDYSEKELKNLIFEELFPFYQRLLETELGMLYLRHNKHNKTTKVICKRY